MTQLRVLKEASTAFTRRLGLLSHSRADGKTTYPRSNKTNGSANGNDKNAMRSVPVSALKVRRRRRKIDVALVIRPHY
jgi:hypothetical protein